MTYETHYFGDLIVLNYGYSGSNTITEMNFREVATVHSVPGVFSDLPQRTLLVNRDGHFCPQQ
jgi:hypothetical protein